MMRRFVRQCFQQGVQTLVAIDQAIVARVGLLVSYWQQATGWNAIGLADALASLGIGALVIALLVDVTTTAASWWSVVVTVLAICGWCYLRITIWVLEHRLARAGKSLNIRDYTQLEAFVTLRLWLWLPGAGLMLFDGLVMLVQGEVPDIYVWSFLTFALSTYVLPEATTVDVQPCITRRIARRRS